MKKENIFEKESEVLAILVSVLTPDKDEHENEVSLDELERLLETAGGRLFATVVQQRSAPNNKTYVGKGKLEEIGKLCRDNGIDLVIFDCELSPAQIKNIEDGITEGADEGYSVRVIDRSMLILDIFALHAASAEGKLQVELAQLRYTAPRLIGRGKDLSRLGGGIGTRGPGESKLESDRRHLQRRAAALEEQIAELERIRQIQRSKRDRSGIPKVAIIGYTNAGKSTLLNRLTDAGILAENKLFATLDPTTRNFKLPSGREILLTDTVGFIRNLPHHLVRAFRSTLDEVKYTDAVMIVTDASDPEASSQLEVTEKLLFDLGASGKPTVYVMNKCDACTEFPDVMKPGALHGETVAISALDGRGIDSLVIALEKIALNGKELCVFLIPASEQQAVAFLYKNATVENIEYTDSGYAAVTAVVDSKIKGQLRKYLEHPEKEGSDGGEWDDE